MMNKKEKIRYDGAKLIGIFPYLSAVCIALMYTICRDYAVICSVIMCALCSGLYYGIYRLSRWHRSSATPLGSLAITWLMIAFCLGAVVIVSLSFKDFVNGDNAGMFEEGSFVHFIFTASMTFNPMHAAAAIVLFSIIIGFVTCYFSVILPRACFLLLPSFIPLILSSRTAGALPLWLQIFMFGSYFVAVFCSAKKCEGSDTLVFEKRSSLQAVTAAAAMAAVAVALGAMLPKNNETLLKGYLDSVASGGFGIGFQSLATVPDESSVNNGSYNPSNELLFTVNTNDPFLLDRWTFTVYNGAGGWDNSNIRYGRNAGWLSYAKQKKLSKLIADMKQGAKDGLLPEYADVLEGLPDVKTRSGEMYIKLAGNVPTSVMLHPLNTYTATVKDYGGSIGQMVLGGELTTEYPVYGMEYYLGYYIDDISAEFAAAMADVDFRALLTAAAEAEVISYVQFGEFLSEYMGAQEYLSLISGQEISSEIRALAEEITAGADGGYEKALAIERWFGTAGFLYDLDFVPRRTDAEYFLFDSKRGICSDFATAATLLSRAAGLPARYVEGFYLSWESRDENGVYRITEENAHAYTQVYINGCGWMNIDATKYAGEATASEDNTLAPALAVIGTAALLVFVFVFRRQLYRVFFAVTYPLRGKRSQIRGVFFEVRRLAAKISGREEKALSCGEVRKILTNTLSKPVEAAAICTAADELFYSGAEELRSETKNLYKQLKVLRREKRRLKK